MGVGPRCRSACTTYRRSSLGVSVEVSAANVARCRYLLGRPFHIENPPVHYAEGDLDMWEFLAAVADAAECGIVLDSGHLIGYHLNTTPPSSCARSGRAGLQSASCTSPASAPSTSGTARRGSTSTPRRCPCRSAHVGGAGAPAHPAGSGRLLERDGASDAVVAASVDRVARRRCGGREPKARRPAHYWSTVPEPPQTDTDATELIQRYGQILHAFYDVDAEPPVAAPEQRAPVSRRARRPKSGCSTLRACCTADGPAPVRLRGPTPRTGWSTRSPGRCPEWPTAPAR